MLKVFLVATATASLIVPTPGPSQISAPPGRQGQDVVRRVLPDLPRGLNGALWPAAGHTGPGKQEVLRDKTGQVVVYVDGQDVTQLREAVGKAGGVVTGTEAHLVRAAVPGPDLVTLAGESGVANVRPPDRALPMSVTSEGVEASGANNWIANGRQGAGAKVGIIDVGVGGLGAAQAAGEVPASITTNTDNCAKPEDSNHGTATSEVIADMAPQAQLFLACIDDAVGFAQAAQWLEQQNVQIIVSGLGFPTTGRGDGTGVAGSPEDVVRQARQAGVLWIAAAGNQALLHWSNYAVDANNDHYVDISGMAENDGFSVPDGGTVTVALRWDAWPTTNQDLDLVIMDTQQFPAGPGDSHIKAISTNQQQATTGGLPPTEQVTFQNNTGSPQVYWAYIPTKAPYPTTRYDLTVIGDASGMQFASSAGSVLEPATSPYVLAVGATQPHGAIIENYSSLGPTVDGRIKPDITGFDQVSTFSDGPTAFVGTSAAAAHVAGAAALLKGANPNLDASQIEGMLKKRSGLNPATNAFGYGTLALGPPGNPDAITAPTGDPYTPLAAPTRILDTRTTLGGHNRKLTGGETLTLVSPNIPSDTSAVAVNLVGVGPSTATHIDLSAQGPTGTSNLNLPANRSAAAVMAIVPVGPDRAIRITNSSGTVDVLVDLLGYFNPSGGSTYFPQPSAQRILDTRSTLGGHQGPLGAGAVLTLPVVNVAGVPANATAVMVNVTATQGTGTSYLSVYPQNSSSTSTVNYEPNEDRANLAVVGVGSDGAIRIANGGGQVHVIVDVVGWFAPGSGSRFVVLPQPTRILETRAGNGFRHTPLGAGETMTLQVGGLDGVPYTATGVVVGVAGIQPTVNDFLSVWSPDVPYSAMSALNVAAGAVTANDVSTVLSANGQLAIRNSGGSTNVLADLQGYFMH
jgi:hypothetical protein